MRRAFFAAVLLLLLAAGAAPARTLRPHVTLVTPSGGQRGTTVAVTLTGPNLGYGTQILLDTPGLTVESVTPEKPPANAKNPDGKIVAQVKIGPDAPLGRHPLRVITPFGPSEVGYFVVGEWPEVAEQEPNALSERPQPLTGPVTVVGRVDGEDVDVYRVPIGRGETMVFACASGSIGSSLTPVLTLRDAGGHDRAFAAALSQPDALLTFTAPQTADYFLSVRDLRYQGGPPYFYRLTVGRIPAVTSVFPLGGRAGSALRLALSGVNLPAFAEWTPPPSAEASIAPLPVRHVGGPLLEVGTLPEATETERNDLPASSQVVTPPVTVNGRIHVPYATASDVDCFRFAAAKGQVFALDVLAARLGSPLDAVLTVLDLKGKELATNDDAHGRDAALTFTAPEAGEYVAQVRDLTGRAGEAFGYRLRFAFPAPDFQMTFSPDCLAVAPGDRVPFTVAVTRQAGFDGDVAFAVEGLPPGVRLLGPSVVPKGQNAVSLLATADAGAAVSVGALRVTGTATVGGKAVARRAESHAEFYVKVNDKLERKTRPAPLPLVAVTGPPDVIVTTDAAAPLALAAGKTVEVKVTVQRRAGFVAKIPLVVQGLPAGVSVSAGGEVPENKSEVTLTLKAEANAAASEATLTILGRSLVDELRFSDHAALPVRLTVTK